MKDNSLDNNNFSIYKIKHKSAYIEKVTAITKNK